jgi:hypothetical protein
MSGRRQLDRALKKAAARDKKRRTKMSVSGKGVFTVARLIDRPKKKR